MTLDAFRQFCRSLPGATEDIKWGQDLVFSVGGKMFTVINTERPHNYSFKCDGEAFAELTEREGIVPAPYLARASWVMIEELNGALDASEMKERLRGSYELVKMKLPKKTQAGLMKSGRRK